MSVTKIVSQFVSRLGNPQDCWNMFEYFPGVSFFVKDVESRLITGNRLFLARLGVTDVSSIAGKADDAFFPFDIAEKFRCDDQQVIRTGKPLTDRLELLYDDDGHLNSFLTTKLPLHANDGSVVGILGTTRLHDRGAPRCESDSIAKLIEFIQEHLDEPLTVIRMSDFVNLSERGFHRRLQSVLGETPHGLVLRIRIQAAAKALCETDETIARIADRCGFPSQSAFTRQFRERIGLTPAQFRTRYSHKHADL